MEEHVRRMSLLPVQPPQPLSPEERGVPPVIPGRDGEGARINGGSGALRAPYRSRNPYVQERIETTRGVHARLWQSAVEFITPRCAVEMRSPHLA